MHHTSILQTNPTETTLQKNPTRILHQFVVGPLSPIRYNNGGRLGIATLK